MWLVLTNTDRCNWVFDTFKEAKEYMDSVRATGEKATIHKLNYQKKKAYA